jgi:ABC-2 type transport system permease protein
VFIPSILLGGVFFDPATTSSAVLDDIARVLPISHFIAGVRGAIQPGGGLSHHVGDLTVLALWGLVGLWFAIRGFSWDQRKS